MEAQGIEKPRQEGLDPKTLEAIAEARNKAEAAIAELEILHRDHRAKQADPAKVLEAEDDYQRERRRIEEKRDRAIEKLRQGD